MAATLRSHTVLDSILNTATCIVTGIGSTLQGSLIVVSAANVAGRTVTGVTDNLGTNVYVRATSAAAVSTTGTLGSDIFYCLSANSGVTSVTITFSGAAGTDNKDGWVDEVTGFTTAAFDLANHVDNQTTAANVDTSAAIVTTSTNGFAMAVCATAGSVTVNPKAGNEFSAGGDIAPTTTNAACALISSTAASHQAQWTDSFGLTYCASIAAFKEGAVAAAVIRRARPFPFKPGSPPSSSAPYR